MFSVQYSVYHIWAGRHLFHSEQMLNVKCSLLDALLFVGEIVNKLFVFSFLTFVSHNLLNGLLLHHLPDRREWKRKTENRIRLTGSRHAKNGNLQKRQTFLHYKDCTNYEEEGERKKKLRDERIRGNRFGNDDSKAIHKIHWSE